MKKFGMIGPVDFAKISADNIKVLGPDRQVSAMRTWTDQNIKKYGPCGGTNSDQEMQDFLLALGTALELAVDNPSFQVALKLQKGWGDEWMEKVVDKLGNAVDFESLQLLRNSTMRNVLKKIVTDNGAHHHGNTKLGGANGSCLHWVSGSERVFGNFALGKLTLIGFGRHGGSSSSYTIDLLSGGTTTGTTS